MILEMFLDLTAANKGSDIIKSIFTQTSAKSDNTVFLFFEKICEDIKTKQAVTRCSPFSEKEDFALQGHLSFT